MKYSNLLSIILVTVVNTCHAMESLFKKDNPKSHNIDTAAILSSIKKSQFESNISSSNSSNVKLFNYLVTSSHLNQNRNNTTLECAPQKIKNIIACFKKPNYQPTPILLVGPSQAGKSTLATAMGLVWGNCYFIPTTDILTKYQHSGSENLKDIISQAKDLKQRTALIFDETTCLTDNYKNDHGSDNYENAMSLLLALNKLEELKHILFIGTTNDATKMPDQLKRRFKRNTVIIEYPTFDSRKAILMSMIKELNINLKIDNQYFNTLAQKTNEWSCKDLQDLLLEADELATVEEQNFISASILPHHIDQAFNDLTKRTQLLQIGSTQLSEQERLQEIALQQQRNLQNIALEEQRILARRQSEMAAMETIVPGSGMLLQAKANGECTIL